MYKPDFIQVGTYTRDKRTRDPDYIVRVSFDSTETNDIVCLGGNMLYWWDGDRWRTTQTELFKYLNELVEEEYKRFKAENPEAEVTKQMPSIFDTGVLSKFKKFCKEVDQFTGNFNNKVMFDNQEVKREDYVTTTLPYHPQKGDTPAFDKMMSVLYSEEELEKILWACGAVLCNDTYGIEKFLFLYGGKGTGKGTVIKIIKMLFDGLYNSISLNRLTGYSEFATGQVTQCPLLIDDDADMSKIRDDTYLLKLTSNEPVEVNKKWSLPYYVTFEGLLIAASNQPYLVRNVDSGIVRRGLVVNPTGDTLPVSEYKKLFESVKFEIPQIANRCIEIFKRNGKYKYMNKIDSQMLQLTDLFFGFMQEYADQLGDKCSLKLAASLYKLYLEDLGLDTTGYKKICKVELQRYYDKFYLATTRLVDGRQQKLRNYFEGLKRELIFPDEVVDEQVFDGKNWIEFGSPFSAFNDYAKDFPAQLANKDGLPYLKWADCKTKLRDVDTGELHWVKPPGDHIVIDFDLTDEFGEKSLEENLRAASIFPPTYAEVSKSGNGLHLHYIYDGNVNLLSSLYEEKIEIKKFTGGSSLRRKLSLCNDKEISHISSGLPLKERDDRVKDGVKEIAWTEKKMRTAVIRNLRKEYHDATKPSMDFIHHIFKQAEAEGVKYDLRDLRQDVMTFAMQSTNQKRACMKLANEINYCTLDEEVQLGIATGDIRILPDGDLIFFDVEVFQNLFVVCYRNLDNTIRVKLINPKQEEIEELLQYPLVGFNNRRYDNHIIYGAFLGKDNMELYLQSQAIISKDSERNAGMYGGAYELSYADIYEYNSKKQGLKKWEIELGIMHDEFELPWDQPVPKKEWERVAEYCMNDVDATVEVFLATQFDYTARKILSELSGLSINSTTQQHAARIIFGSDKRPQDKFIHEDLSKEFPGYKFEFGKSSYMGEDPSEGGYVYSEPGVYKHVLLMDVESMHPHSLIAMNYFGPYTQRYADLVNARLAIKHGNLDKARKMFDGKLEPYLKDEKQADELSYALKIVINIVYGMTSAKFDNVFRAKDNQDNVVAKRGALFMITLKHELQKMGVDVIHIKTDSVKVVWNHDKFKESEIKKFIFDFGKKYKYTFEHEATYEKMALVNKAVYIAKYGWAAKESKIGTWDAVGAMFQEPYVFKKLATHEPIVESDYALSKSATAPIYLGDRFVGKNALVYASKTGQPMERVDGEKRGAITGTKGFDWKLYSEFSGMDDVDMEYYDLLVKGALEAVNKVGSPFGIFEDIPEEYQDDLLPF